MKVKRVNVLGLSDGCLHQLLGAFWESLSQGPLRARLPPKGGGSTRPLVVLAPLATGRPLVGRRLSLLPPPSEKAHPEGGEGPLCPLGEAAGPLWCPFGAPGAGPLSIASRCPLGPLGAGRPSGFPSARWVGASPSPKSKWPRKGASLSDAKSTWTPFDYTPSG